MKKIILFLLVFVLQANFVIAQDRFRRDYNKVVVDVPEIPDLHGTYYGNHAFVFNYNKNGDVMHYSAGGKNILYIRTSPIEEAEHDSGVKFSYFKALDQDGEYILIKIFHKKRYGIQIFVTFDDKIDAVFHYMNNE